MKYVLVLCSLAAVSLMAGKNPFFLEEKKPEPVVIEKKEDVNSPKPENDKLNIKIAQGEVALPPLPATSMLKQDLTNMNKMFVVGIVSKKGKLVALIENKEKQVGIYEKGQKMIVGSDVFSIKDVEYSGINVTDDHNKSYFIPYGGKPSDGVN